jgi:hypothetical protein
MGMGRGGEREGNAGERREARGQMSTVGRCTVRCEVGARRVP